MALDFPITAHESLDHRSEADLEAIFADPGFGRHFTDHMGVATWTRDEGWHDAEVRPYGPLQIDPASAVLHYAQEIFEGLKAYRHADGSVWLFRPEKNAERFIRSAHRLALPELPVEDFIAGVEAVVRADQRWVPSGAEQSLYLRPFMIAHENFLGVRAAHRALFAVIASPVGAYFPGGVKPVDIWVSTHFNRAGAGGTGAAKCGGNYAASLLPQEEAHARGCSQVLFLDASEHRWIEELGGMNLCFITADGRLVTPELSGSILEGVTRDSILTVAGDLGLEVEERRVDFTQLLDDIRSGAVTEVFACGTAAVVTPINGFKAPDLEVTIPAAPGEYTMRIREMLLDIQYGRREDTHGWMRRVC